MTKSLDILETQQARARGRLADATENLSELTSRYRIYRAWRTRLEQTVKASSTTSEKEINERRLLRLSRRIDQFLDQWEAKL